MPALAALPHPVLATIAFHLVCAPEPAAAPADAAAPPPDADDQEQHPYLYGPPPGLPPCLPLGISRLPALLAVNRAVHDTLAESDLYARLCLYFLDTTAAGRRWRSLKRRKDGGNVPNDGLAAHLVHTCRLLRFYRTAARQLGIPLPPQARRSTDKPPQVPSALFDPALEHVLAMTLVLMMEDDGRNHHQLRLVSAPLFVDMLVYNRLHEHTGLARLSGGLHARDAAGMRILYNDGWPVESVLNTAAVWLVWMFTTEEKIASESDAVRERLISLVLPFVVVPYRYASALVPPTHYTLPLPSTDADVFQRPMSRGTAHGSFPVYHSFPSTVNPPHPPVAPRQHQQQQAPAELPSLHGPAPPIVREDEGPRPGANDPPAPPAAAGPIAGGGPVAAAGVAAPLVAPPAAPVTPAPQAAPAAAAHAAPTPAPAPAAVAAAAPPIPAPGAPGTPPSPTQTPPRAPSPGVRFSSYKPPPAPSNSQAHPSLGVYVPWYCPSASSSPSSASSSSLSSPTLPSSSWSPIYGPFDSVHEHLSPRRTMRSPYDSIVSSQENRWRPLEGAVLTLPLVSGAAKLVFMSRREAIPMPVMEQLPVSRAAVRAARAAALAQQGQQANGGGGPNQATARFAAPTQEDLREVGAWCTWGRRMLGGKRPGVEGVPLGAPPSTTTTNENGEETKGKGKPTGEWAPVPWYADSRRWDADWWRMVLCDKDAWQAGVSSTTGRPYGWYNGFNFHDGLGGEMGFGYRDGYSGSVVWKREVGLGWRMGRVYERGMLSGLWQGYMHLPNSPSLSYVANTRQYPSNFSEGALGVMMRPLVLRLAEHAWVPTPGDPGRFKEASSSSSTSSTSTLSSSSNRSSGKSAMDRPSSRRGAGRRSKAKAKRCKGKGYWERSMSSVDREQGEEEYESEYKEPGGPGPVPAPRPSTMTWVLEETVEVRERERAVRVVNVSPASASGISLETTAEETTSTTPTTTPTTPTPTTSTRGSTTPSPTPRVLNVRTRHLAGFRDENMNNAWFPGAPGSLAWEAHPHTSLDEGVWRDPLVRLQDPYGAGAATEGKGAGTKERMGSIVLVIPGTFERSADGGELVEGGVVVEPVPGLPPPAVAGVPGAGVGLGVRGAPGQVREREEEGADGVVLRRSRTVVRETRVDNPNLARGDAAVPAAPALPPQAQAQTQAGLGQAPQQRAARGVVPGSRHVYETVDPPEFTSGGNGSVVVTPPVREGVHERMESVRGWGVCKGLRRRKGNSNAVTAPGESGADRGKGEWEHYAYPHPGCLACRAREAEVARRKRQTQRALHKQEERRKREKERAEWRAAVDGVKRGVGEALFASVGLGEPRGGFRSSVGGLADEDEEDEGVEDERERVEELELGVVEGGESEWESCSESDSESEADDDEDDGGALSPKCPCTLCKSGLDVDDYHDRHEGDDSSSSSSSDDDECHDYDNDEDDSSGDGDSDGEDFSGDFGLGAGFDDGALESVDMEDTRVFEDVIPKCDAGAEDIVLTGGMDERHSEAWGSFTYYGRVRPWDGLVGLLRIGRRGEVLGTMFFYGYIYGGRNLVGNWRMAGDDPVMPRLESSFVLSRRAEE